MKRLFLTCLFKRMREPVSQTTHLRVLSAPISARSLSLPLALGMLSAVSLFASANGAPEERSSVERTGEERAATPRPSEACPGHPNIRRNSEACREKTRGGGDGRGQRGSGAPARADWQVNEDSVLLPRHSDH